MDSNIDEDVLSFFANNDDGMDSADEFLENTSNGITPAEDKHAPSENDEYDDETEAEIAALKAKIELLKSKKKSPKEKEKQVTYCKPNAKVEDKCKHGVPFSSCFFCTTSSDFKREPASCKHGKSVEDCFFCATNLTENEKGANLSGKILDNARDSDLSQKLEKRNIVSNKSSIEVKKDENCVSEKSRSIFDVIPEVQGISTTEFSKKKRMARSHEDENVSTKNKTRKLNDTSGKASSLEHVSSGSKVSKNDDSKTELGNSKFFGGIEVSKPVMSSQIFEEKTNGRSLIRISKIETKVKGHDIEGDWVTVGVLVKRVTQKQSANGKNFCVWHLSDLCLGTENHVVALFLFGDCYKAHWKIQVGRVIALLNANLMKQDNNSNQSLAISIDNPKKLMELGDSKFLGGCKGTRKSDGKCCSMFVNKKYGDFCEYHVQTAFKKAKSGRMDLQSGGRVPSKGKMLNHLKKDISDGVFYYGGQTVKLQEEKKEKKSTKNKEKNDCSALKSLMGIQVRIQAAKEYDEIKKKRELEVKQQKETTACTFLSKNRNELLRLTVDVNEKSVSKCNPTKRSESQKNMTKFETKDASLKVGKETGNCKKSVTKKASLSDINIFENCDSSISSHKNSTSKSKLKSIPVLGRGLKGDDLLEFATDDDLCYDKYTGEEPQTFNEKTINLEPLQKKANNNPPPSSNVQKKTDLSVSQKSLMARKKAAAILQANGPLQLEDPNIDIAKKKPVSLETIKKKVDDSENSIFKEERKNKKKSMLAGILGHVDLNSVEGKHLLEQKSKHIGAVRLAEAEKEEKYFDSLERKENMAAKLTQTFEIKVSGIACRDCKYLAESQSEFCKDAGHAVAKIPSVIKRFFFCKSCKTRCCSYNKLIPKNPCNRCGQTNFEKTSMGIEKKGPLLSSETLQVRGTEQKFLNQF